MPRSVTVGAAKSDMSSSDEDDKSYTESIGSDDSSDSDDSDELSDSGAPDGNNPVDDATATGGPGDPAPQATRSLFSYADSKRAMDSEVTWTVVRTGVTFPTRPEGNTGFTFEDRTDVTVTLPPTTPGGRVRTEQWRCVACLERGGRVSVRQLDPMTERGLINDAFSKANKGRKGAWARWLDNSRRGAWSDQNDTRLFGPSTPGACCLSTALAKLIASERPPRVRKRGATAAPSNPLGLAADTTPPVSPSGNATVKTPTVSGPRSPIRRATGRVMSIKAAMKSGDSKCIGTPPGAGCQVPLGQKTGRLVPDHVSAADCPRADPPGKKAGHGVASSPSPTSVVKKRRTDSGIRVTIDFVVDVANSARVARFIEAIRE